MSVYALALFVHILGVLGVFVGIALDWVTILRLRQSPALALVREATSLVGSQARLIQISSLLLLIAGIYMTVTQWGWDAPWIRGALLALIVMGALSGGVHGRRLAAICKAAGAPDDMISPALQRQIADPLLLTSVQTAGMIGLGVVFLMTVKPNQLGSLITLAAAVFFGVLSAQPWRRPHEASVLAKETQPSA